MIEISQATLADLDELVPLFGTYRVFYGQTARPDDERAFLTERIRESESVIFIARIHGEAAGFTQLYPSFTSVGMKRIWILNDLFADPKHRKAGVGRALIEHSFAYARQTNRSRVMLSTDYSNTNAQRLYENIGFRKEEVFTYEYDI